MVEAFVIAAERLGGVFSGLPGPSGVEQRPVRRYVGTVTELMGIAAMYPESVGGERGHDLVTDAVEDVFALGIGVGRHQVQTEIELLGKLTGERKVIAVLLAVCDEIRCDLASDGVHDAFAGPVGAFRRFAGQLDGVVLDDA